jgi:hypothetical protein
VFNHRACLFHFVVRAAQGEGMKVADQQTLRSQTAEFISTNTEHWAVKEWEEVTAAGIEVEIDGDCSIISVAEYAELMQKPETFAGELEIEILCELLHVRIMLYTVRYFQGKPKVHCREDADIYGKGPPPGCSQLGRKVSRASY